MSISDVEHCDVVHKHADVVLKVHRKMPDDDELYDLAELFKVFGDSTRIRILYVLFDKIALNVRPVLENGVPEASYPSSHTMLSLVAFGSAAWLINRYFVEDRPRRILTVTALVLMVLTVAARLLSGFHWLTDIIGGLLISAALLAWFAAICDRIDGKQ